MSLDNNAGIILFCNRNASNGAVLMPNVGTNLDSTSATSPLVVNIGAANRVVLTVQFGFGNVTSYTVRVMMSNTNVFNAYSGGTASPAVTGGSTLLVGVVPVLSIAQNDTQPGFQALDHVYTNVTSVDYIYLPGNLVGQLVVRMTPSTGGNGGNQSDFFTCGVSIG